MTYSIVYDAVQIKTTHFEHPVPLINTNELAAGILIACRQAGVTPPELTAGMTVQEFRTAFFQAIEGKEDINPLLLSAIREYPHEKLTLDEAAQATYEFGQNLPDQK